MSGKNDAVVRSADELYKYADDLRWAAGDLQENYHDMKVHAAYMSQQWEDSSAERFLQVLEQEEHIIQELVNEFTHFESVVRKRADMVSEYVARGKRYSL